MNDKYKHKHLSRVWVETPSVRGWAIVRGIHADLPVVGQIYIVDMEEALPNEIYPFSAICVPEGCLTSTKLLKCGDNGHECEACTQGYGEV